MASEKLSVEAKGDHVAQWTELREQFEKKRGFDEGRNRKKIPRTTNADVKQLANFWHRELLRAIVSNPFPRDKDKASRARWLHSKAQIDYELKNAKPDEIYARNEWFWQEATTRLALYLQGLKAIPSSTTMIVDSVFEVIEEGADAAQQLVKDVAEVGDRALHKLKIGTIIAASVVGAAVILPPVIRAFRK